MTVVETGADESFSHPDPAILWANGVRWLFVYPGGSDPAKAVTRPYWDACLAQGIAMGLIDEHGNNQMVTGGPGFGTFIANEILDYYEHVLGVAPASCAAYFVFADPRPALLSEWPVIVARAVEIRAAMLARGWVLPGDATGNSLIGGYADGPLLEHLYGLNLLGRRVTPNIHRPYGLLFPVSTWGACPHAAAVQDPNTPLSTLGRQIDRDFLAPDVVDLGLVGQTQGGPEMLDPTDPVVLKLAADIASLKPVIEGFTAKAADGTEVACHSNGVHWWLIPSGQELADSTGVLAEMGVRYVIHQPAGPVDDLMAFGRPLTKESADRFGLAFP
jgi:hypothetical protein